MKILTYIFAAVWALLAFNFLIIDSYYIAGSLSMFFGLICISLISDFKKYETNKINGGRKFWVNTVGMTGFCLQILGVAMLASDLLETSPDIAYIFGSIFCFVGFGLFSKAHIMLKQGAENVIKAEKDNVAEVNRDSYYANATKPTKVNIEPVVEKTIEPIKASPEDEEVSEAEIDELLKIKVDWSDTSPDAIVYYKDEFDNNEQAEVLISAFEPSEVSQSESEYIVFTIIIPEGDRLTVAVKDIYRLIDLKTEKAIRKNKIFDWIEDKITERELNARESIESVDAL